MTFQDLPSRKMGELDFSMGIYEERVFFVGGSRGSLSKYTLLIWKFEVTTDFQTENH